MDSPTLEVYESDDGRLRTGLYAKKGSQDFCIAEKTAIGSLITELSISGTVINQVYSKENDTLAELNAYFNPIKLQVKRVPEYKRIEFKSKCTKCGTGRLERELDLASPSNIKSVPVVPLFKCASCGQKFYSISDEYLRNLVESNSDLFSKDELEEKAKDEEQFIKTLHEYIIRIFASKKITRLRQE